MSNQEYISKMSEKNSSAKWLPALGFLLIIALGAVSFVLSEPLHKAIYEAMFQSQELSRGIGPTSPDSFMQKPMQYGVGLIIFIVLVLFMSMLYTIFSPKQRYKVHEKDLKKERDLNDQERRKEKLRKQKINKQMAAERQRQMEEDERAMKNKRR